MNQRPIVHRSFSSGLDGKELTLDALIAKSHSVMPNLCASSFTRIEAFLRDLDDEYGPEVIADVKGKLGSAGITLQDLHSPGLTKERLKAIGISLGLRTTILKKRDSDLSILSARSDLIRARCSAHEFQETHSHSLCESAVADLEAKARKVTAGVFVQRWPPRTPTNEVSVNAAGKQLSWATRGSSYHLVLDVERALLSNYARLLVYDSLATGQGASLDASTLEQLLIKSFRSSIEPRPRTLSLLLTEDRMESILFRAVQGWTKAAKQDEIEKLRAVCLAALSRYSVLLCKTQESTSDEPTHAMLTSEVQIPRSEEVTGHAGIGSALMILLSLASARLPVTDLIEFLAKSLLLSQADSCHSVISSVAQVLQRLENLDFSMGPEIGITAQIFRNSVVEMIQTEVPHLRPGALHSRYLQNLLDSVIQLEILSADSFDREGKLGWEFCGQVISDHSFKFGSGCPLAAR